MYTQPIRNFFANVLPCSVIQHHNSQPAQGMHQPKPSTPGFSSRTHRRTRVTRHPRAIPAQKPTERRLSLVYPPDAPHVSAPNSEPSTIVSQKTLSNRNKIAFKIPPNSMKIKVEPNSNRNKNRTPWRFAGDRSPFTNQCFAFHQSPITTHQSRLSCHEPLR
jgi:hypothetical protein